MIYLLTYCLHSCICRVSVNFFNIFKYNICHSVMLAYSLHGFDIGITQSADGTVALVVGDVVYRGIGVKLLEGENEFAECRAEAF